MKIGYARVSTARQKINLQIEVLKGEGCEHIYQEVISGTSKSRKELNVMLRHLRPGDTVVVYKLDRLGRSMKHLLNLVTHFKENNINFKSLNEGITLDDTAAGQLMFGIFAAFAQFERDLISERTKAGLAAARAKGRTGGRPKGLSKEAEVTAAAAKTLYLEDKGLSVRKIAEQLDISVSTLYRYLKWKGVKVRS